MASTTSSITLPTIWMKLVPFFATVFVYFLYLIPSKQPSLFAMIVKCLPIFSLMLFMLLYGVSRADNRHTYTRRILLGLCFSCLGDALLMWPPLFELGILAFTFAQVTYTWAFGFKTLNYAVAAVLYAYDIFLIALLIPNGRGAVLYFIPVYPTIVMTMTWRSIDRGHLFKGDLTWSRLSGAVGGILFCISDSVIFFNLLYAPVPHAQLIVMATYYAAQLLIVLSIVDSSQEQEARTAAKQKYNRAVKTN